MRQLKNIVMGLLVTLIIFGSTAMALTPAEIDDLVASMTLDEKVGQMTQPERGTANTNDVKNYFLGSILSGGGSHPSSNTLTGWADMHDDYQNAAMSTRLGIPILYGIDAVHGHSNVIGATIFPHNIGLGATRDPDLIEEIGRITAKEVRCTGIEWTFAPCVAVVRDERWGRTYEGFGEDPELATMFSGRFVKGLQGIDMYMNGEHIVACAKHYVGDGGTVGGDDQGNTVCTEQELRDIHMPGYYEAIANGVGTIMPSFSSWNGLKMHENSYLLTDVLKTELGFDGFLISDWHAVDQVSGNTFYDDVVLCVNAGIDMGMQPGNWQDWITHLKTAAGNGDIPMSRIDDAVRRILTIKNDAGLLDGVTANILADRTLVNGGALGSQAHRDVARDAVRKSLVLLKNDGVLPISKGANVFVAGKNANDIGNQCGGWTISWQGSSGNITTGTTILQGIQNEVAAGGGSVTFSENGSGSSGHDVAIVVIGETPYAEGNGDNGSLTLDSTDTSCLSNIDPSVPTIVVLVSGRPMMISDYISGWDAFVAAWLPGTEGDGVAEVLFGDYDFTGVLPHTWPRNIGQVPINVGDSPYDPLYAYGFGLDHGTILPSVTITSPTNGSIVPAGNITITADASVASGSITKVEFYEGLNLLGEDTTSPYSYTWNSVADGCYTIKAKATSDVGDSNTDSVSISVGTGCAGENSPFLGSPFVLPTRIEVEDYDLGGEGVAFHDSDSVKDGDSSYRSPDPVDLENCSEGTSNLGFIRANEWLEYTVTVPASGTYDIDIRVASQDTGGNFHIEFNGVDVTGNIHAPATGGWQTWTTVSATAALSAGTQIMRYVNANSGDEYNINYFDFTAPTVTVPDVVGTSETIGHQAITGIGLELGTTTYAYSDTVPENIIISQNPTAGTSVPIGTSVDTVVSLGPQTTTVTVPNVIGMTQAAAESAITGVGLVMGTVSQAYSETVPLGDTISQNPIGGASVSSGSSVDIVISQGPLPIADGLANADIDVFGTRIGTYNDTRTSDDTYEELTEIESGGNPNSRHSYLEHKWTIGVAAGTTVTFNVEAYHTSNSEGDDFIFAYSTDDISYTNMLTVTKTSDDNISQSYTLPPSLSGTVYIRVTDSDQSIANKVLDTLFIDEMYIDSGSSTVTVPDVVGMDQAAAQSAITGASLTVGTVSQAFSDTVAIGDTISQNPIGGTSVSSGSSVDISVSLGFRGDLDDDGDVDIVDVQIMASEWATAGTQADIGPIDINGDGGDGWVDFGDFAVLASDWQKSIQ
ncbi:MAG: glycoside hydrolase family 3 N-terminal domain-containing protein [Planctomycetota bacterium]|jgi:beta-glucosidase